MNKTEAQVSIQKLQNEVSSLYSSALVTLFEIDIGILADERQIAIDDDSRIFRFHNNTKLITSDIYWKEEKYIFVPIYAEGFELSSRGTLPTPTLSLAVNDGGIMALSLLRNGIKQFGDLIGAKVTRRRTFVKFLDALTFPNGVYPDDFEPDPNVEFPSDIYYVNRKVRENKSVVQYELNSILDMEGIQLPRRPIIARTCPFSYRGAGCLYENGSLKNDDIHGETTILPLSAPSIATDEDKLISELLGGINITFRGKWQIGITYNKGDEVYLLLSGIKYRFVANQNNVTAGPFDTHYWIQDKCSKKITGCLLRWGQNGSANVTSTGLKLGELPFGGFLSTERLVR